jgi:4-hydroxybutyrate CoA-transferase
MHWKEIYKSERSQCDAVKHIKSGDRVVFGHAAGEPKVLVDALVRNAAQYKNVEIVHMWQWVKVSTATGVFRKFHS